MKTKMKSVINVYVLFVRVLRYIEDTISTLISYLDILFCVFWFWFLIMINGRRGWSSPWTAASIAAVEVSSRRWKFCRTPPPVIPPVELLLLRPRTSPYHYHRSRLRRWYCLRRRLFEAAAASSSLRAAGRLHASDFVRWRWPTASAPVPSSAPPYLSCR